MWKELLLLLMSYFYPLNCICKIKKDTINPLLQWRKMKRYQNLLIFIPQKYMYFENWLNVVYDDGTIYRKIIIGKKVRLIICIIDEKGTEAVCQKIFIHFIDSNLLFLNSKTCLHFYSNWLWVEMWREK